MSTTSAPKRGQSTRDVCVRYGIKHPRSVLRWEKQGIIPPADFVINNRKYWWESTLERHDRKTVAERSSTRPRKARLDRPTSSGP
jgi:hypothetical protein